MAASKEMIMFFFCLHSSEDQTLPILRIPRYKTTLEVHGGWHHLVFLEHFPGWESKDQNLWDFSNHPVFNNCFTVSTILFRAEFLAKKVSGTPLKLDHGLVTYELPEVPWENLTLENPWLWYTPQIYRTSKTSSYVYYPHSQYFLKSTQSTLQFHSYWQDSITQHTSTERYAFHKRLWNLPIGLLQKSCQQHCLFCNVANKGISLEH